MNRLFSYALLLMAVISGGCGDSNSETSSTTQETSPTDQLRAEYTTRNESAGNNPRKLLELRNWILGLQTAVPQREGASELTLHLSGIDNKIIRGFETLVERCVADDNAAMRAQLSAWADPLTADTEGRLGRGIARARKPLLVARLKADPDNDVLRTQLGYVCIEHDLDAVIDTDWMEHDLRMDIESVASTLASASTRSSDGKLWVDPNYKHIGKARELGERIDNLKAAHDKRLEDPFYKQAMKTAAAIASDLGKKLNTSYRWTPRVHKPYVLLIERDNGWDESKVAIEKSEALLSLYDIFYKKYRAPLALKDIAEPVPVVIFRKHSAYYEYGKAIGASPGAVGHFEPGSGRLFVSDTTEIDTTIHEGTHQLVAFNRRSLSGWRMKSYWFEEGVAEFFGGNHRTYDVKLGKSTYEIGRLQKDRINYWRQNEKKAYTLIKLLSLTKADERKNRTDDSLDLNLLNYSQGWFLVFFLNNYLMDAEGHVVLGKEGKYFQNWLTYFKGELDGKTGRDFFLECMGLLNSDGSMNDEKFAAFEKEFMNYWEFVNYKFATPYHVKDGQIVPWDQVVNKRGRKIGEKYDDILIRK